MAGMPVPGPSGVVDDHVLQIRPADPGKLKRHGLPARRPAGGGPDVVNDHIFKTQKRVSIKRLAIMTGF